MIPDWMKQKDTYEPVKGSDNPFLKKTIVKIAYVLSSVKQEKPSTIGFFLPVLVKLLLNIVAIIILSASQNLITIMLFFAIAQSFLALYPASFILKVLKLALLTSSLTLILFIPSMIMNPEGMFNNLIVVVKVFITLELVHIFGGTTKWNDVTVALRRLHIPGIFIFTLDITLKYIVLLGNLLLNMLVAVKLRSVGKNNKKYQSLGGALGATFVKSMEMSQEMYEAMRCRGFTDDYRGL